MTFLAAAARTLSTGALMFFVGYAAAQQTYPSKPIRFIVPYPPGGTTTPLARVIGEKLTEIWGQAVLVDNRAGGNTIIGTEAAARSAPDGHTILLVAQTHVVVPSLLPTPYDPIRDFDPVATVSSTEYVLALHPSVPANNLREFIALAKSKPGTLNYASSGGGTTNHLSAALFESRTGVKMQHIPYKGSGPALTDLLGGQVQLYFSAPLVVMPHVKTGKLKAMAVSGETRQPGLPQLPTFTEAGLPNFELKAWYGVIAPAGLPKPTFDKLSAEINKILAMPDVNEKMSSQGMEPFISTPDQFAARMKTDFARFAQLIKTANIKLDQ